MKYFIFLSLALVLAVFSCKKVPVQPIMAPLNKGCDCANEVSAQFLMEEMTTGNTNWAKYTDTDSIFSSRNVRFTALEGNAEYTWYIGTEVLHTQTVTRYFPDNFIGKSLPITLVVKKKTNRICFPKDDGYDSIVKHLTVVQVYPSDNNFNIFDTTFMEGVYRMKSPLLPDSIDIKIDYKYHNTGVKGFAIDIYNYNGKDSNCINRINMKYLNYRQFWITSDNSYTGPYDSENLNGSVYILKNQVVEMNFTTGAFINDVYIGIYKKFLYRGRKL